MIKKPRVTPTFFVRAKLQKTVLGDLREKKFLDSVVAKGFLCSTS